MNCITLWVLQCYVNGGLSLKREYVVAVTVHVCDSFSYIPKVEVDFVYKIEEPLVLKLFTPNPCLCAFGENIKATSEIISSYIL